jgi:hypothetical protein
MDHSNEMSDPELQTNLVGGCVPIVVSVHRQELHDTGRDLQEYVNQYKVVETIGCGRRNWTRCWFWLLISLGGWLGSFGLVQLWEVASSPESSQYAVKVGLPSELCWWYTHPFSPFRWLIGNALLGKSGLDLKALLRKVYIFHHKYVLNPKPKGIVRHRCTWCIEALWIWLTTKYLFLRS